jgi:predicted HAD superfamily Cof-like phosphohydrolase
MEKLTPDQLRDFLKFRVKFLQEELNESINSVFPDEFVDAMIDLCVVAIGTLDLFEVDAQKAWDRVHKANMRKIPGIKSSRPNPFGFPDLIKPEGWEAPKHQDNVGLLAKCYDE